MYMCVYTYIYIYIYVHLYNIYMCVCSRGASLGRPMLGQIGWGSPSNTGPAPLCILVVSPCRCEPLQAGCCGGEGGC